VFTFIPSLIEPINITKKQQKQKKEEKIIGFKSKFKYLIKNINKQEEKKIEKVRV